MELTADQRKQEQRRRRFIANAWMLMEKTGQALAPSKDYCQLLVTTEGVIWRWLLRHTLWLLRHTSWLLRHTSCSFSAY